MKMCEKIGQRSSICRLFSGLLIPAAVLDSAIGSQLSSVELCGSPQGKGLIMLFSPTVANATKKTQ